ncbi:cytochrome c3 family protein [Thermodesulfobacteriota bacterium]
MKFAVKTKSLLIGLCAVGAAFLLPTLAQASVVGVCSDCHTMHNSQDGDDMGSGPYKQLLKDNCWQCHADDDASQPSSATEAPQVGRSDFTEPTGGMLAGGYFDGVESHMHNVWDVDTADPDSLLGNADPPGWDGGVWNGFGTGKKMVGCSGTDFSYGCHREGGHHANTDGVTDGSTVGASFRFLSGITGREDTDWELSNSSTDHNQYLATNDGSDQLGATTNDTINALCGQCHGNFHTYNATGNQDNAGSDWIRHPTDLDLSDVRAAVTTDYNNYTVYTVTVPVGSTTNGIKSNPSTVDDGIVLCISCHRPHGSPYDDLLRWDYNGMDAGTATAGVQNRGCFKCHDSKDNADG